MSLKGTLKWHLWRCSQPNSLLRLWLSAHNATLACGVSGKRHRCSAGIFDSVNFIVPQRDRKNWDLPGEWGSTAWSSFVRNRVQKSVPKACLSRGDSSHRSDLKIHAILEYLLLLRYGSPLRVSSTGTGVGKVPLESVGRSCRVPCFVRQYDYSRSKTTEHATTAERDFNKFVVRWVKLLVVSALVLGGL